MKLVNLCATASAAVLLHVKLVVAVGIFNAYRLRALYILACCIDVHTKEHADNFFHNNFVV